MGTKIPRLSPSYASLRTHFDARDALDQATTTQLAARTSAPIKSSQVTPGGIVRSAQIEKVIRGAGLEGVVAKRVDSFYEPGIRTRNWIKVRFSKRQEFVLGGYKPAGDSFDSVLVGYYDKRQFFYAGKVRARLRPATRRDVFATCVMHRSLAVETISQQSR